MTVNAIKDLFEHGQFQAILDRLAQQDIQAQIAALSEPDQVALSYYHSRALTELGNFKQGLHVATTAHTTLQATSKKSTLLLASLSAQIRILEFLGEIDEVQKLLIQGDALLQGLTAEDQAPAAVWIPVFELTRGEVFLGRNQNLAFTSLSQALTNFEKRTSPSHLAETLRALGLTTYHKGEYNTALEYTERSLALYEKLEHNAGIARVFINMGHVYLRKGEIDKAFNYYQRGLTFAEASRSPIWIALALRYVGAAHLLKSEFDTALGYFHRSLALVESIGAKGGIADTSDLIGRVYYQKGELDTAFVHLQRSVNIATLLKSDILLRRGLVRLINLTLSRQDRVQAQTYLNEAKTLATELDMTLLVARVAAEETQLATDFEKWQDLIRRNAPLQERITEARIEEYLLEAKRLARLRDAI